MHLVTLLALTIVCGQPKSDATYVLTNTQYIYKIIVLRVLLIITGKCLPFVTMFTILNIEITGSLSAPWFFAHTDTVPVLY